MSETTVNDSKQCALWRALRQLNFALAISIISATEPSTPPASHLTAPSPSDRSLTPLHLSALLGSHATVAALLAAKVPPDAQSVLHAARNGHVDVVQLLLQAAADVADVQPEMALLEAAWHGCTECVKTLVDFGVRTDARARDGATPLHYAALAGSARMVATLVDAGADVGARDAGGRTAVAWASAYGSEGVVRMLKGCGQVQTKSGGGLSDVGSDVTEKTSFDLECVPELDSPVHMFQWRNRVGRCV